MEESGIFKTAAFGGFDKKSVLTYIDALNEKFHGVELEHQAKLNEFTKAQDSQLSHIKKLEAQLAEMDGKLNAVAEQLERERSLAKQAQEMIAQLDNQNKILEKQTSDKERELQIQIERSRQLQFKAESLDYKSKKYDEMSSQVGSALLEARRTAEGIIADANMRATEIINQANAYMRNFHSELGSFKGDATRLRKSIEEILFVLNDRIDVMQEVVSQVEGRFDLDNDFHVVDTQLFEENPEQEGCFYGSTPAEQQI